MSFKFVEDKCRCGCGTALGWVSKSTYYRLIGGYGNAGWIKGHRGNGSLNCNWKGGVAHPANGYRLIKRPGHPNARKSGYILEHRAVASEKLGRPLTPNEIVHHVNHVKLDNSTTNLEVITPRDHIKEHDPNQFKRVEKKPKTCISCGKKFIKPIIGNHKRAKFCSMKCRNSKGSTAVRRKITLADEAEILRLRGNTPRKEIAKRFGLTEGGIKGVYKRNIHYMIP
ncbi:HNH endonuclease [Nitrosovibrio sp. Nv4]|uniref:HNH endonuclease n=1 Tax=Nitrosovibrio sp. Nv4 TaxID=1945880 RepID=UPI000BE427A2|nr:HNH endonuclease [Nitrosovibrio sp. Nv4]